MEAQDVMTAEVVTVQPSTSVRDIAALMIEHRISGLPVINTDGRPVGIVTDGDLCHRTELGTERQSSSLLSLLFGSPPDAKSYVQAHGRTARDVMTTDVVAVAPDTTLHQIVDLFERKRFRRVPVVVDGKLVGIVSRADLVRALASTPRASGGGLNDRQMRDLVMAEYKRFSWGLKSEQSVIVIDGVVHLWGFLFSEVDRDALRVAAEGVPGVKGVVNHTVVYQSDLEAPMRTPTTLTVVEPERGPIADS